MSDKRVRALQSLAKKIEALDLTEAESALLDQILARAASADDVAGFTFDATNLDRPDGFQLVSHRDWEFPRQFGRALGWGDQYEPFDQGGSVG